MATLQQPQPSPAVQAVQQDTQMPAELPAQQSVQLPLPPAQQPPPTAHARNMPARQRASPAHSHSLPAKQQPLRKPVFIKVQELRPGTAGHNLTVRVVSSHMVMNRVRPGGNSLSQGTGASQDVTYINISHPSNRSAPATANNSTAAHVMPSNAAVADSTSDSHSAGPQVSNAGVTAGNGVFLSHHGVGGSGGRQLRIAECIVGDETGVIVLTARNEQVDILTEGAAVNLRNAKIDMFNGSMRLAVDKWGRIEALESSHPLSQMEIKVDSNLSLVEYELVSVIDE